MTAKILFLALGMTPAAVPADGIDPEAKPGYYSFDRSHVSVSFSVRHLGLSRVRGTFVDVSGTIRYDPRDVEASSVTAIIRTASVSTGNERRDTDLRDNFLAVERFPTIRFQSTVVEERGGDSLLRGVLTIRDVAREVEMPLIRLGSLADEQTGAMRIGFATRLSIARQDYGVERANRVVEAVPVVGDSIHIEIELEAVRLDPLALPWDSRAEPSIGEALHGLDTDDPRPYRRRYDAARAEDPAGFNFATRELVVLGLKLLETGRAAAAVEVLTIAVEADPSSALALETLGLAQAEAGRTAEAAATLHQVLTGDPDRTTAIEALRTLEEGRAARTRLP